MKVPVLLEPVIGDGYRALGAGGLSVGLTAEGSTPEEAINRLAEQVRERIFAGAKLVEVSVEDGSANAGKMPDA